MFPKVACSSQPWALGRNPFGIRLGEAVAKILNLLCRRIAIGGAPHHGGTVRVVGGLQPSRSAAFAPLHLWHSSRVPTSGDALFVRASKRRERRAPWVAAPPLCAFAPLRLCVKPVVGILILLFATLAHAQDSQFFFDPNGNLLVQTAEVVAPPQILAHPQNRIVGPGESATFSIVAANTRLLTYQWRFNGTNISGATNDAVVRLNVSTNHEGEYRVVLSNPFGSVTSAPALLTIDSDADGVPDSWELAHFVSLTNSATADFDGDGSSNLQEFLDGTNPTNSTSVLFHLTVIHDGGSVAIQPNQSSYTNGQSVTLTATAVPGGEPFHAWLGDIVTRTNPVTLVMTNNKTVFARFTPIVFQWANQGSGDWETAANWIPNLAPGLDDIVLIRIRTTVTLNSFADCREVTLGGDGDPTLTGSGTLTVRENLFWNDGTMSGSGRTMVETNGNLYISRFTRLSSRTLENGGTVWLVGNGSVSLDSGAGITNRPGASFNALGAGALLSTLSASRFDNAGIFRKWDSTGTTTVGMSFNNSGSVEIQSGALVINGGFTNRGAVNLSPGTTIRLAAGGVSDGTLAAAATAVVEWTGGTFTLNPGTPLNGAGVYRLNGGNVMVAADLTVENLALLSLSSTLGGPGTITIASGMNWTAGTISGTGQMIIAPGATLNAAFPSQVNLARTLENGGTVNWTGAGTFGLSGAVITNRAGALFHAQNAAQFQVFSGANRIDNAGTFRKSASTGTTTVANGIGFNNSGAVEIQSGTLVFNGGFTNLGTVSLSPGTTHRLAGSGVSVGTFTAATTAVVEWTGGAFTLNPGAQLNGAGLYRLNGGSVVADSNLTVENLDLVSAFSTLSGAGAVTIASRLNWTAGLMIGSGKTIIQLGATLNLAVTNAVALNNRTLENAGTVLWTGPGLVQISSAVITNRAGGLFEAQNAARFEAFGLDRFDNAGTFRKSVSPGTTTVPSGVSFNNFGTVDIRSGILAANGGYVSAPNALLNCALGGTMAGTNYGQLKVAGAVTLNGALSVDLLPGFSPATNDTFTVLTAGTRSGAFASFSFPSNAVTMQLSNSLNSVIVRVTGIVVPDLVLLPPLLTSANVTLCWITSPNKTYRLEFTSDLGLTNWDAVPGEVITSGNQACVMDALTSSNRFYRVRVVP